MSEFYRGGIFPFIIEIKTKTPLYIFGIDRDYLTLMDFGGHREPEDLDIIETAIREFGEESLGIFGPLTRNSLKGQYIIGDGMFQIFHNLGSCDIPTLHSLRSQFQRRVSLEENPENIDFVWLNDNQLRDVIWNKQEQMYPKLTKLLRKFISPI